MEAKQVKGLMEAYASVYSNISESHFKVGDEVICKNSGMEGEVIKLDKPDGAEDEKYYTVKREDGKTMKYAPNELKLAEKEGKEEDEKEEKEDVKEAKNGGIDKSAETKFHKKLDTLVHHTFGKRKEEQAMKEDADLFDYLLEYLVAEGYADTNDAALAIMANMSEEWRQSIIEQTARIDYTQDKFNRQNAEKSGSGLTYIPGKQNAGQALQKAKESARQMGKLEGA
jgi:hypothetical protein